MASKASYVTCVYACLESLEIQIAVPMKVYASNFC